MPLAAFVLLALGAGGALFIHGAARIFKHDDGSPRVIVQCASGFVLFVAVLITGAFHL